LLKGNLVQFLSTGASGKYYLCNGGANAKHYDDCAAGTPLTSGLFNQRTFLKRATSLPVGQFGFVFVPAPNVNGQVRLLLEVVDDQFAPSQRAVVIIDVLPINDPPAFQLVEYEVVKDKNGTELFLLGTKVNDTDFKFGREMIVTYTIVNADNTTALAGGFWLLPEKSSAGKVAPCVVSADGFQITCREKIEKLNPWLTNGIELAPDDGVSQLYILLNVSDIGNIDKLNRTLDTQLRILLDRNVTALVVVADATTNNVALIAAPIAGVLAGALIAALIFLIKRKQAKAAVENYFDKFALGMEGMTHASPLYVESKKGGESPLYKGSNGENSPH